MILTVTSQGRITIPAAIRKKLGIKGGTRFQVIDTGPSIILRPIKTHINSKQRHLEAKSNAVNTS